MGIIWRSTMPLLSTLAALVIIVHSAEENLEQGIRDRRYDLRPRLLETRPLENEQPWRMVRAETMLQQPAQSETWKDSLEEPPIRRRGRKRKRRPPAPVDEDETLKMTTLPDEERHETKRDDPESGKRRAHRNLNRWVDTGLDTDKRVRRRGQRRKRPSLDNWPRLSEFGEHYEKDKLRQKERETKMPIELNYDDDNEPIYDRESSEDDYSQEPIKPKIRRPVLDDYDQERTEKRRPYSNARYVIAQETEIQEKKPFATEDKSLSEFSMEVMSPLETASTDDEKLREDLPKLYLNTDKAKKKPPPQPIDPITLRGILKRSNGTSLSEILQQHNLTLADLLSGNENAIAILKSEKILQNTKKSFAEGVHTTTNDQSTDTNTNEKVNIKTTENIQNDAISEYTTAHAEQNIDNDNNSDQKNTMNITTTNKDVTSLSQQPGNEKNIMISTVNNNEDIPAVNKSDDQKHLPLENRNSGSMVKRRFPGTIRRKLRMRPMVNNTYKSQINRDLIAQSARRYIHHSRRNATKSRQWREMIPLMVSINGTENQKEQENILETTTSVPDETTIVDKDESTETIIINDLSTPNNDTENETESMATDVTEPTTISIEILATEMDVSVTERPKISRPTSNASSLRRQAFNNRLKKKRMKQRTSTTEAPTDDVMKNLLEMGDLVSSSEFIARTQLPKVTSQSQDHMETVTELEDFLTTETVSKVKSMKSTRHPTTKEFSKTSAVTQAPLILSTEETAKIEIEEIFNDTRTSVKLSKILKERNMTLNELLEHRERGSSHVHLADIFHNASREPNPPEPFLSKSLLEPISKETYPLRAILEANSHEQSTKVTTIDPIYTNHANIPVMMDFGNNVNENAENMGIMSLFNNFTKETIPNLEKSTLQQDSKGTPYKSTIIAVNATEDGDTTRESRMLNDDQDMISWNEIFSMIRRTQKNESKTLEKLTNELPPSETYKKIILEEDVDGDGLIVLEDLQHLRDTDKKDELGSEEKIEFNSYEGTETPMEPGILNKAPSSTKSVTVATASIVGLAMILFLLTYAALKWKQQRTVRHKNTFGDERIPSPVFENRKIKKNCSSRSISPMLPTSNIYTMNTLDSQTGKDSPEYMWDTLRKPFQ